MLILIPAIDSLWQRAAFVAFVVVLLGILVWVHGRFIPSAALYFGDREPSVLQRTWPALASWLIAATASFAAALMFYLLTRSTP